MSPRTPSTRSLKKAPTVKVKQDLIKISRSLTLDITCPESLVDTLGPLAFEFVKVHGEYGGFGQRAQFQILEDALSEIWEYKEKLRKAKPGRFIVRTILRHLHEFYVKKGWQKKWERIGNKMRKDVLAHLN